LGEQEICSCCYPMVNNDRLIVAANERFFIDANLVGIYPLSEENATPLLTALLNFTGMMIAWELYGIANLGEGAIKQNPIYFKKFSVPNPLVFTVEQRRRLLSAFKQMAHREIKSIFEELGFSLCNQYRCRHPEHPCEYVNPADVFFDKIMPDRRELDKIVFEILGLTEEEQLEVYRAVVELVKNRLVKARSV